MAKPDTAEHRVSGAYFAKSVATSSDLPSKAHRGEQEELVRRSSLIGKFFQRSGPIHSHPGRQKPVEFGRSPLLPYPLKLPPPGGVKPGLRYGVMRPTLRA